MDLKININVNKIVIPAAIVIAGLSIVGSIVYININKNKSSFLSAQEIADRVTKYIDDSITAEGGTEKASVSSTTDEVGVYKIIFNVGDQPYTMYVSKDGKYLFPIAYDIATTTQEQQVANSAEQIVKSDRPDVKLFVMSYCPFGLQAEKMYLPVYNLLKDSADMGIYFVDYAMHEKQEIDENLRQYCIQVEQKSKYSDYLSCFVASDDYQACLTSVQIDTGKLGACVSAADQQYKITQLYNDKSAWIGSTCPDGPYCFSPFNIHADLNGEYGVQGSPTVIINGQEAQIGSRSPENFKEIICQAFNNPPQECSQVLSSDAASSGFGTQSGSTDPASCGG